MKSKMITITKAVIWIATAVLIAWDIVVAVWGPDCSTISCILGKSWAFQYSTLPFAWGVLTGHLFWVTRGTIKWMWPRLGVLFALAIASIVLDVVDLYDVIPILPTIIGVPLGRLLWPQSWPTGHPLLVWKG